MPEELVTPSNSTKIAKEPGESPKSARKTTADKNASESSSKKAGKKKEPHNDESAKGKAKGKGPKTYRVKEPQDGQENDESEKKGKKGDSAQDDTENHWFLGKYGGWHGQSWNTPQSSWNGDWDWHAANNSNFQRWAPTWHNKDRFKSKEDMGNSQGSVAPAMHCWIDIPWWSRGMLIGKNGEKLQEIREKSKVQRGYLPPDTYGIYLKGTPEQVEVAETEFYELLKVLKSEISTREGHGGLFEFETLTCPPKWPVEKLFTNCADGEVQVVRRWKSEVIDGAGEPSWDEEVLMDESIVCIRASREQLPNVLLALNPKTEMGIVVHQEMYDHLMREKTNFFTSLGAQPGVAEWDNNGVHDDAEKSKIFKGRGVDRVMHEVSNAIFNFIREARSSDGKFRVVDLSGDMVHVMGQRNIEDLVRKMEGATGATAHWVQKRWCYGGDRWIIDDCGPALLVITGAHHAVVIMEQRLKTVLQSGSKQMTSGNSYSSPRAPVVLQIDGRTPQYEDPYPAQPHHLGYQPQSSAGLNRYAQPFTPQETYYTDGLLGAPPGMDAYKPSYLDRGDHRHAISQWRNGQDAETVDIKYQ